MKIDDLYRHMKVFDVPQIELPPLPPNPVYETRRLNRIDQQRDRHEAAYARAVHLAMLGKHLERQRVEHNAEGAILVTAVCFLVALLVVGVVVPLAVLPVGEDIGWGDINGKFWSAIADGKVRPVVLLVPTAVSIAGGTWIIVRTRASKISEDELPDGYNIGLQPQDFTPAFAAKERQMEEIATSTGAT